MNNQSDDRLAEHRDCNRQSHFEVISREPYGDGGYYIVRQNGTQEWTINGGRHRLDGPALITRNGSQYWYRHGKLHRQDGPAVISQDCQEWYRDGKRHNENGPAVIFKNGYREWIVNSCQPPLILTKIEGETLLYNQIDVEIDFSRYPSHRRHRLDGYHYLDEVDLTLFRLEHRVVEMPYE